MFWGAEVEALGASCLLPVSKRRWAPGKGPKQFREGEREGAVGRKPIKTAPRSKLTKIDETHPWKARGALERA